MTKRRHEMPFGAALQDNGAARFALWAPAARSVDLCLVTGTTEDQSSHAIVPMNAAGDGWFALTNDAKAGTRYFYRIDGEHWVPDPASRHQPEDVHGPSELVDPGAYDWQDTDWMGRPWEESVIYELHVGSFSVAGTFDGIIEKLDHLVELGVTAIELMPLADFPGRWNWGYDGVYLFAPDASYGRPDRLKALVDAAHARGIMVLLDVVYNHFGPEGNYLHRYAPSFFDDRRHTPWGGAINFDGENSRVVREFFIHNALFWLDEYHLDGLRLDAVHAIVDDSEPDILVELAERVDTTLGGKRHIHLVLENDANAAQRLGQAQGQPHPGYTAQWNDDLHHVLHLIVSGEAHGYYQDYADRPAQHLGRCLREGLAFQGEPSRYRGGRSRGQPSGHLPPTAYVSCLQNHDHVGNRARGERIGALISPERQRAALALLLLAPSPPLLFMGQEWNSRQPFPFFCDFEPGLSKLVAKGRRRDLAHMLSLSHPDQVGTFPDPSAESTFRSANLDWNLLEHPDHRDWLDLHRTLLSLRRRELTPRLRGLCRNRVQYRELGHAAFCISWMLADDSTWSVYANLEDQPSDIVDLPAAVPLFTTHAGQSEATGKIRLLPWFVGWFSATCN